MRHALTVVAVAALLAAAAPRREAGADLAPAGTLRVWHAGAWHEWWRADASPARWGAGDDVLARAIAWRPVAPGIERGELRLAAGGMAWRTRLVIVRVDPARVDLSLALALDRRDGRPDWSIERAPVDVLLALNAGQFVRTQPWGWLVLDGHEHLPPGVGPLSSALAIDTAGRTHWIPGDSLADSPWRHAALRCAFQSYPTLLAGDGVVPAPLRVDGSGIDRAHRDTRLALGETRTGALLIVLTRFDALGGVAGSAPVGLTTPEMAAVMGALGAHEAMMLDGGISAQLALRESAGGRRWNWHGWRKVPLALLARARRP